MKQTTSQLSTTPPRHLGREKSKQDIAPKEPDIAMKSVKTKSAKISCNCGCTCKKNTKTDVNNRRVNVSVSPAIPIELTNNRNGQSKKECLTCDSGCTAECIVSEHLVRSLDLPL